MNKEEFLDRLRVRLDVLEEKEIEDIISEYSEHIDEKIKSGTNESDAIKEFGDLDELTKEILDAYKINQNFRKNKFDGMVSDFVNDIQKVFNKIIGIIAHGTMKQVLQLIILIILALLLVVILRIPFNLLEDFFAYTLREVPEVISEPINIICTVVVNLLFIALSFIVFIKLLKEKITDNYKLEVKEKKETKSTKKSSKKDDDKVIEENVKYKSEKSFFDIIGDLLILCVKLFVAFFLIPAFSGLVGCSILFAMIVYFSIKYLFLFGPLIGCLGVIVGCVWFIELVIKFIFNKKIFFGRTIITLFSALIMVGLGMGFTFAQLTNLSYNEHKPAQEIFSKQYNVNEIDNIKYFNDVVNYIEDDAYENDVIMVKVDGYSYFSLTESINESDKSLMFYSKVSSAEFIKEIAEDLKDGELYNYSDIDLMIKVYGNKETLSKIKGN